LCKQEQIELNRRLEEIAEAARERHRKNDEANKVRQDEAARLSKTIVPNLKELQKLSPYAFEDRIAQMFKRLGFEVEQTAYSGDGGRDGILTKQNKKYLYECKRYGDNTKVGRPEIQILHSAMVSDGAESGYFVSTGSFTKEAAEYARSCKIELVDGPALLKKLVESNPAASDKDIYFSICRDCGERVTHRLRAPADSTCPRGHVVSPSLTLDDIISNTEDLRPFCINCGKPMVKRTGPRGDFWGCVNYFAEPSCRYTRPFHGTASGG
jgi:restriction system protein